MILADSWKRRRERLQRKMWMYLDSSIKKNSVWGIRSRIKQLILLRACNYCLCHWWTTTDDTEVFHVFNKSGGGTQKTRKNVPTTFYDSGWTVIGCTVEQLWVLVSISANLQSQSPEWPFLIIRMHYNNSHSVFEEYFRYVKDLWINPDSRQHVLCLLVCTFVVSVKILIKCLKSEILIAENLSPTQPIDHHDHTGAAEHIT